MGIWLPALTVFVAVAFGTLAVVLAAEAVRDAIRRRRTSKRLTQVVGRPASARAAELGLVRTDAPDGEGGLFPGGGILASVQRLLTQARVEMAPVSFLLLMAGVGMATGLAVFLVTGQLLAGALGVALGVAGPFLWVRRRRTAHLRAFEEHFPEAIELLTRAIRAGHPISSGMRMVADEAPEAVAREFRRTFEEQRFGLPFQDALMGMVERIDLVDVRIFVIAVQVQREVGGNLAEILDNLADTIRARFHLRRQLRVYTAQGRLSGWVLTLLPIGVGLTISFLEREYVMTLFNTTPGLFMLGSAVLLQVIGFFWIRAIVNIDM